MTFYDFLDKDPTLAIGIFILIGLILITVLVVAILLTRKRDVSIGKDGISIKAAIEEQVAGAVGEYEQLRTLYDDQRDDISRKIWDLEKNAVMERYMTMVEERLSIACKHMREVHENLIAAKLPPGADVPIHPDVRRYTFKIRNVYYELKDELRNAMRRNHFVEKSTDELHLYAMQKLDRLFKLVEDLIDGDYDSEILPIRELREEQRRRAPEYGQMLMGIFTAAKSIAVQIQADVDMLKKAKRLMQEKFAKERLVITSEDAIAQCYSGGCRYE